MNDKLLRIRRQIEAENAREGAAAQLSRFLDLRVTRLHNAIKLPPQESAQMLKTFVFRYIDQVPEFIEAIDTIAKEAGIYEGVRPLLDIACDYFLSPPNLINDGNYLDTLLDEAYLAHRLLEEVNDRFIGYCGIPLAPMDMTRANVIVHELIGEPFANELDQAVLFSSEILLNQYNFTGNEFKRFIAQHKNRGWSEELKRWPCLAEDLAIVLDFGTSTSNSTNTAKH